MIQLIVSDMDGTLLGQTPHISKENIEAIQWAKENGATFAIATGRHITEAKKLLHDANIKCPLLSVNGAALYDENDNLLQSFPIDRTLAKELVKHCQQHNSNFLVELTTTNFIISDNQPLRRAMIKEYVLSHLNPNEQDIDAIVDRHASLLKATYVNSLIDYIDTHPNEEILKVLISYTGQDNSLVALRQSLQSFQNITISSSHINNIEITAPHATKGNAITTLANQHNIPLSDIMALGDNMNDYSMLSIVGYSVAMQNAVEPLKSIATYITDTNVNNGVAKAIYHYIPKEVHYD